MAYDINSDVLGKSGANAAQLNSLLEGTGLAGLGNNFADAEGLTGINALFIIAHAALESAWGKSKIAKSKNNLFGIGAIDSAPGQAMAFDSFTECIGYYAGWLKSEYLTEGGTWFEGTTLHDIFIHYSSSHDVEAASVAGIMNELAAKLGGGQPAPGPKNSADSSEYTVVKGDSLSAIAEAHDVSLADLESANPQYSDNWDLIHTGDRITIPSSSNATSSAPAPSSNATSSVYTVIQGDNLWAIAKRYGITLGRLERANPQLGPDFGLIHPGNKINIPR